MASQTTYDCIIIGGGLAGLSAGVRLSLGGKKILLLEQRHRLGGRTYSYRDDTSGDLIDNGQHLLMGCYTETRQYQRSIGTEHLAELQPTLGIEFLHPTLGRTSLHASALPAPLHALSGLLGLTSLSFTDRLNLIRVGAELLLPESIQRNRLAGITVSQWLDRLGQGELSKKYLWDIIAIGSLNDDPRVVSAFLFYRVLRTAFLGKRENASLLIPRTGLTELLVEPAEQFIRKHGGEIRTDASVEMLQESTADRIEVQTAAGETYSAKTVIAAVPWYAGKEIFRGILPANEPEMTSSPILSIYIWLDRVVTDLPFAALLETRAQWMFNRTALTGQKSPGQFAQCLCFVISGASEFVEKEKDELVAIAMEDLRSVLPEARTAFVKHSVVIKEKRATFSPTPAVESKRPSTTTSYPDLFLAGDWTDTGFPSTIEGAVLSGHRAARAAMERLSKSVR